MRSTRLIVIVLISCVTSSQMTILPPGLMQNYSSPVVVVANPSKLFGEHVQREYFPSYDAHETSLEEERYDSQQYTTSEAIN